MRFFKISSLIFLILINYSCIHSDDFQTPVIEYPENDIIPNTSIQAIKKVYEQSGERIYTFNQEDPGIIEAYVISSDEGGNFYKMMIVQDTPSDPHDGIRILIDQKSYYNKYNFGRKIYIKTGGLSITAMNDNYTLGYLNRNELIEIPGSLLDDFIIRSSVTEKIIPKKLNFDEFTQNELNLLIKSENVQFKYNEMGKSFSGEPFDKYSAERQMIQCGNMNSIPLHTSTYAKFKLFPIPESKGDITAILTTSFADKKYVLVLNDTEELNFTDPDRCDPDFLNCNGKTDGENILFYEDFEQIKRTSDLLNLGWKNINRSNGTEKYKKRSVNGNAVMRISAYGTGEHPMEVWLVTPGIDLNNKIDPTLTFKTGASYDNGNFLTVWISDDFNGNIETSTWKQLKADISVGPGNDQYSELTLSGKISLNCYTDKVFIGFRYSGGDPGKTTTYDLDDVKILIK